jgi:TonB family protein
MMKTFIIISLLFHFALLLAFRNAFPLQWNREELRTYQIELIRPPVKDIETDDLSKTLIDNLKQEELPAPQDTQDTISLDTKDKRYISYTSVIKEEIMRQWQYPPQARAYLIEGSLTAFFSLTRDGSMTRLDIIRTSGHKILDQEVIRAIRNAAPFPPFPESIIVNRLNIQANFSYQLTSKK